MKCRRAHKLIHDFLDGVIGDQDRLALEQHLGVCGACEKDATALRKSLDLLHNVEPAEPGDNFAWKVRLRIQREKNEMARFADEQRGLLRSWNRHFALSALSAFVGVVVVGYFAIGNFLPSDGGTPSPRVAGRSDVNLPKSSAVEETAAARVTNPEPVIAPPSAGFGPSTQFVGTGSGVGNVSEQDVAPGVLIEDKETEIDPDQLLQRYRYNRLQRYRMQQLQDQVETLHSELIDCGRRCGAKAESTASDE